VEAETWRWIAKNRLCHSDDRAKDTREVRNKRKSKTCPEEEAYVDMLRTTDLLSRGSTLESKIKSLKIDKNRFKTDPEG
jgi:hypothetical protein